MVVDVLAEEVSADSADLLTPAEPLTHELVDVEQLSFTDETRWWQYLEPEVNDAIYYVNNLEYVASPMANLDSNFLDITPEWLAGLVGFTANGRQDGLMRSAVEQLFVGEGDPFVRMRLGNETPATFHHFEITDPDGLEASLNLPPGRELAPIALFRRRRGGALSHLVGLPSRVPGRGDASPVDGVHRRWLRAAATHVGHRDDDRAGRLRSGNHPEPAERRAAQCRRRRHYDDVVLADDPLPGLVRDGSGQRAGALARLDRSRRPRLFSQWCLRPALLRC